MKLYVIVADPVALAVAAPVAEFIEITEASDVDHVPPEFVCVNVDVVFKQILGELKIAGPTCNMLFVAPFIA